MIPLVVVIPTYNEADNIGSLTDQILEIDPAYRVLVVDDSSPDGTGSIARRLAVSRRRIEVLHRPSKEGIGPAYIQGFRRALSLNPIAVAQMDADHSHDPQDLPRLVEAVEQVDVAIGSRYCGGVRVLDWSVRRLALSLLASSYVKLILNLPVDDPTSGFKCFRAEALRDLPMAALTSRGYSFQIEVNYWMWKLGMRIREVPIVFHERQGGGSKITRNILCEALWVIWRIRLGAPGRLPLRAPRSVHEPREERWKRAS